jgi:hypothetical protein
LFLVSGGVILADWVEGGQDVLLLLLLLLPLMLVSSMVIVEGLQRYCLIITVVCVCLVGVLLLIDLLLIPQSLLSFLLFVHVACRKRRDRLHAHEFAGRLRRSRRVAAGPVYALLHCHRGAAYVVFVFVFVIVCPILF